MAIRGSAGVMTGAGDTGLVSTGAVVTGDATDDSDGGDNDDGAVLLDSGSVFPDWSLDIRA